jgi:hypothetical protein
MPESESLVPEVEQDTIGHVLACYRLGDPRGALRSFTGALKRALSVGDRRTEVYLRRCAALVHSPSPALISVTQAFCLAGEHGMPEERELAHANLGLVYLERGEHELAKVCLGVSAPAFEGTTRAAALNNLALAVAAFNRAQACGLLVSAMKSADQRHCAAILSNRMAIEAEEALRPPDFSFLVSSAAESCDAPLFEGVLFNHVRSLFGMGEAEKALAEIEVHGPEEADFRDGPLGVGRWACLQREILTALGQPVPWSVELQASVLSRSTERHAWLYRTRWALCPIPLDEPAELKT